MLSTYGGRGLRGGLAFPPEIHVTLHRLDIPLAERLLGDGPARTPDQGIDLVEPGDPGRIVVDLAEVGDRLKQPGLERHRLHLGALLRQLRLQLLDLLAQFPSGVQRNAPLDVDKAFAIVGNVFVRDVPFGFRRRVRRGGRGRGGLRDLVLHLL